MDQSYKVTSKTFLLDDKNQNVTGGKKSNFQGKIRTSKTPLN